MVYPLRQDSYHLQQIITTLHRYRLGPDALHSPLPPGSACSPSFLSRESGRKAQVARAYPIRSKTENPAEALASTGLFSFMVPKVGLEPTHPFGYWILNPERLPVPPLRHKH